ncbi:hypothetical protein F5Y18DRAFT_398461 [Xylariaceae sp. FL1019]|nr:hypothetical protein F5Y18DRAFT_398461 [Xylariaceae sp. FL1019]
MMNILRFSRAPKLWSIALGLVSFFGLISGSPIALSNHPSAPSERHQITSRATIADVPTVTDIRSQIASHGRVGNDISLFYTSLSGGSAIPKITAWYKCNGQPIYQKAGVAWDGILPNDYLETTALALQSANLVDKFQKRASQAFGAESAGIVFVFYPDGKGDPIDICRTSGSGLNPGGGWSVWCGLEFPALMMNPSVDAIFQVDPDAPTSSSTTTGNLIWSKGDGVMLQIQGILVN